MAGDAGNGLDGKVALITGAASGIGRATARALVRDGARVALGDIDADGVAAVAADLNAGDGDAGGDSPGGAASREGGARAIAFAHDAGDEAAWADAVARTEDGLGPLDILVNNAGVLPKEPLLETTSLAEWRRVFSVNVDGVFLGVRAGIRSMGARGGAIVNLASVYGLVGATKIGAYAAAKHAVRGLTKSAALECADLGYPIRINAICPGFIDTGMTEETVAQTGRADIRDLFARMVPAGRMGRSEEIAEGIVFLASDRAAYINGVDLVVDGGFTAR